MALAIDTGFPVSTFVDDFAATTVASPAITTSGGGELIVALVWIDSNAVTSTVTGGGLTWANPLNVAVQNGRVEVWTAWAAAKLTTQTITATLTNFDHRGILVLAFTGAQQTPALGGTNTASGTASAATVNVTATAAGSIVVGAGTNVNGSTNPTIGSGNTSVVAHSDAGGGNDFWAQKLTALTSGAGSVTIGTTAPTNATWNMLAFEVLAAATTPIIPCVEVPDYYMRPKWIPWPRWEVRPAGSAALVVIVPRDPIPPSLPEYFLRQKWVPTRSWESNPNRPDSLIVIVPRDPIPPTPPGWWRPIWNPLRGDAFQAQLDWAPVWTQAPLVEGPDGFMRPIWNPNRAWTFEPRVPSQDIIVPGSPIPPTLPERFVRVIWNPERSATDLPSGEGVAYLLPESTFPIPPALPERFGRPIWNPERSASDLPAGDGVAYILPESVYPIPPVQPGWWRRAWNPEKTSAREQARPAPLIVIVPRSPLQPVLPPRWARPIWNPERDATSFPTGDAVPAVIAAHIIAPSSVEIDEVFQVRVTVQLQRINETSGGTIRPRQVRNVLPTSTPGSMRFGDVSTNDIAGYGMMVIGTQPQIIQGNGIFTYLYEAVAFAPGTYTLSAAIVDSLGNYLLTNTTQVVVHGV